MPNNHVLLPKNYLPYGLNFNFVLSQNKFGQYKPLSIIANELKIPLICLEHCTVDPRWNNQQKQEICKMVGNVNVFISQYSAKKWNLEKYHIIEHCVNTDVFMLGNQKRNNKILVVANDFINRDAVLNFSQFKRITKNLGVTIVGNTPGLSEAAKDINELVNFYQTSRIFLNTAHHSPIPMSVLESMSCGCAVVSINACAIPEYIEHGVNGFLANNDDEMRHYLELLLRDEYLATKLGNNARETIIEKCSKEKFTQKWDQIFNTVYQNQIRFRKV